MMTGSNPQPALFATDYRKNTTYSFPLTENNSVNPHKKIKLQQPLQAGKKIQLANGMLVIANHNPQSNSPSYLYLWDISTAKLIHTFAVQPGNVDAFLEIENNVLVVSYRNSFVEIYDLHNPNKPVTLASIKLPGGNEHIFSMASSSKNSLVFASFASYNGKYGSRLKQLHFDNSYQNIRIEELLPLIAAPGTRLFTLKNNNIIVIDKNNENMCIYNFSSNNKNIPLKTIKLPEPSSAYPSNYHLIELPDNNIITAFSSAKHHTLRIDTWDLNQENGKELSSTLELRTPTFELNTMHQRKNRDLLLLDSWSKQVLIFNPNKTEGQLFSIESLLDPFVVREHMTIELTDNGDYLLEPLDTGVQALRITVGLENTLQEEKSSVTTMQAAHFHFPIKKSNEIGTIELVTDLNQIDQDAARTVLVEGFISAYEQLVTPDKIKSTLNSWHYGKHSVKNYYETYFAEEIEHFKEGTLHYWVQAKIGSTLVGWATFKREKNEPNAIYMELLVVHREHREKSIGKQLVHSLLNLNIVHDLKAINLCVRKINRGGRDFYLKLGFELNSEYEDENNFVDKTLLEGMTWKNPTLENNYAVNRDNDALLQHAGRLSVFGRQSLVLDNKNKQDDTLLTPSLT